jgi:hypothetical protein
VLSAPIPRLYNVYEGIEVTANSQTWLDKYRDYLSRQTLEVRSNESVRIFNDLRLDTLYRLYLINDSLITKPPVLPTFLDVLGLRYWCVDFLNSKWLRDVKGFDMGELDTEYEVRATLRKLGSDNLKTLNISSFAFDLELCPVFPNCTTLIWTVGFGKTLTKIQDKFPSLVTLRLNAHDDELGGFGVSSLEPLRGSSRLESLFVASSYLLDLSPLSNVPLTYLDVRYCDRIVDFSHVAHVESVKRHE